MRVYLATFSSTHAALAFEGAFEGQGALVPVPPTIRAGCGMAWRFVAPDDAAAHDRAAATARAAGLADADWQLHLLSQVEP